jgi:hypothetical protein
MREKLEKRYNSRERFRGVFDKYGLKSSYRGLPKETILLLNVQLIQGEEVTEHLWFNLTKGFEELGDLYPGDIIAFDARVRPYMKGYVGRDEDNRELDYKLSHPTDLKLVKVAKREEGYYFNCTFCGYHNVNQELDERLGRCRRCGRILKGELPITSINEAPKLEQKTLPYLD